MHTTQDTAARLLEVRADATAGSRIVHVEAQLCDLPVETERTDALQTFVKQETILVRLRTADGTEGIGYSYTIGTGGGAVPVSYTHLTLPTILLV